MKKYIIITFCMLTSLPMLLAQGSRDVTMLHGFGGTANTWQQFEDYQIIGNSRNLNVTRIGYNTTTGLDGNTGAAADAYPQMPLNTNPLQTIGIGHSYGGLTLREIERRASTDPNWTDKFGGYITVGTVNQGAELATAFTNGGVQQFFVEGCQEVITNPLAAIDDLFNITNLNINQNLFCNDLFNAFTNSFGEFTSPATVADLTPNNPAINAINNFNSTKPRITLWGNEQSPVHWRLVSTLAGIGNPTPSNIPYNQLTGNEDMGLVTIMNNIRNAELTGSGIAASIANILQRYVNVINFIPFATPNQQLLNTIANLNNASTELLEGAVWLDNSEMAWNTLTGAFSTTTTSVTTWTLNAGCLAPFTTNGVTNWSAFYAWYYSTPGTSSCYNANTTTTTVVVNLPSDGVLHRDAAEIPGVCHIEVPEAGHVELVNHLKAHRVYDDILNGDLPPYCNQTDLDFFEL